MAEAPPSRTLWRSTEADSGNLPYLHGQLVMARSLGRTRGPLDIVRDQSSLPRNPTPEGIPTLMANAPPLNTQLVLHWIRLLPPL